jgi:hypothetical protein
MQLSHSSSTARCSTHSSSRRLQLQVRAQAPLSGSTAGASSNGTGSSSLPPLSFERPAGGGSRSFDLPRSSDIYFAARSDILRPSGGAARGAVFATSGLGDGSAGSIDRPGGRGGRDGGLPKGWDTPAIPQDPAQARPGGRGGRDAGLSSSGGPGDNPQDPAQARPGGRGGRDAALSSSDAGDVTPTIDRPGGRGGRDGPSGGGGDGGSSGGGGSGGSGDSSSSSSGGEGEGWSAGKIVGSVALYAGVIAAAWFGYQAMNPQEQPAAAPVKPCCAGKGKKK